MGKGDSKQQMGTNNSVAAQQLALQQKQLAQYNDYMKQILAGGGYLPGVKAALTSTAIQQIPGAYQNIAKAMQTQALTRGTQGGGAQPGSGLGASGYGQLLSAEEQAKSNSLNQITSQGQNNIAGAEAGGLQAAGIYSNAGTSALGDATSAANNSTNATTGMVGSIIGGGLGVLGKVINPIGPCWVAAELYGGWLANETNTIRHWLLTTWWMQPFVSFYRIVGPKWAALIRRNNTARAITKGLFDLFLRFANA